MKTAEQIQEDYAESKGYDTFYTLIEDDMKALDYHVKKVQELYAEQEVEKHLEIAANKAKIRVNLDIEWSKHDINVDKQSITNIKIELT